MFDRSVVVEHVLVTKTIVDFWSMLDPQGI